MEPRDPGLLINCWISIHFSLLIQLCSELFLPLFERKKDHCRMHVKAQVQKTPIWCQILLKYKRRLRQVFWNYEARKYIFHCIQDTFLFSRNVSWLTERERENCSAANLKRPSPPMDSGPLGTPEATTIQWGGLGNTERSHWAYHRGVWDD